MWLIAGLGNIGARYEFTRHNIGFSIIDALARDLDVNFKLEKSFQALIARYKNNTCEFILAKPQTFMNNSGISIRSIKNFYKIENILVIHDDLDLDFGHIRFKQNGSSGGNNGLKSIISHIGEDFYRLRFGIGKIDEITKIKAHDITAHVLSRFSADTSDLISHAKDALLCLIKTQDFIAMQNGFTKKAQKTQEREPQKIENVKKENMKIGNMKE